MKLSAELETVKQQVEEVVDDARELATAASAAADEAENAIGAFGELDDLPDTATAEQIEDLLGQIDDSMDNVRRKFNDAVPSDAIATEAGDAAAAAASMRGEDALEEDDDE